jgi:dihydroorotase
MKEKDIEDFDLIGARLVDPNAGIDRVADLFIRKGIIYYEAPLDKKNQKVFNLSGHVILPGLLDLRAHNRVPGLAKSENIETLTKAAAKGGFSSILAMPNTSPYSDNPATIRYIQDRVKQSSKIKVYLSGCLTIGSKGESIAPIGSLKDVGVVAVTDCPSTPSDNEIFTNAIKYAKMFGLTVIDFPQDPFLTQNCQAHESALSIKMGLRGSPRLAEELSVQRAILVAKHLGVSIHISSISSAGSVSLIKLAKESNIKITADVSAHHLISTEDLIRDYNTCAKLLPPLREESDRISLIEGIKSNIIDACNSSHEPYSEHLKNVEFDKAPCGATGLETALLSFLEATELADPFPFAAQKLSSNPHNILALPPPTLKDGGCANLVVINQDKEFVYNPNFGESLSLNTPLVNHKFKHSIKLTVSDGKIAYEQKSN